MRQADQRHAAGAFEHRGGQHAIPPVGTHHVDHGGAVVQDRRVKAQHVRPRLALEPHRLGAALRREDRGLPVGVGQLELGFGLAVGASYRLLRLEADAVDRVSAATASFFALTAASTEARKLSE